MAARPHLRGPRRPHAPGDPGAPRRRRDIRHRARPPVPCPPARHLEASAGAGTRRTDRAAPRRPEPPLPAAGAADARSRRVDRPLPPLLGAPARSARRVSGRDRATGGVLMAATPQTAPVSLRLSRSFAAPPEKVFRAWTEPATLKRWSAPGGMTAKLAGVLPAGR